MNALDLIVIAGIALSALFAFARGFVKEALSIGAWVGAGLIALYGLAPARPFAQKFISSPMLADSAAGLVLFIGSLIVLSIITSMLARRVQQSALSAVDRALGLLFGIARGVVLACLGFLALSWAIQEKDWPAWVRESRTRPVLMSGGEYLKSLLPAAARERGAQTAIEAQKGLDQAREAEQLMRALATPTPAATPAAKPGSAAPGSGYKPQERKEMDRLFQSTQ
jgi:membrane protein required for colicin V production